MGFSFQCKTGILVKKILVQAGFFIIFFILYYIGLVKLSNLSVEEKLHLPD